MERTNIRAKKYSAVANTVKLMRINLESLAEGRTGVFS